MEIPEHSASGLEAGLVGMTKGSTRIVVVRPGGASPTATVFSVTVTKIKRSAKRKKELEPELAPPPPPAPLPSEPSAVLEPTPPVRSSRRRSTHGRETTRYTASTGLVRGRPGVCRRCCRRRPRRRSPCATGWRGWRWRATWAPPSPRPCPPPPIWTHHSPQQLPVLPPHRHPLHYPSLLPLLSSPTTQWLRRPPQRRTQPSRRRRP